MKHFQDPTRDPTLNPAPVVEPKRPLAGFRVCIDPGHPSEVGEGTRGKRLTELRAAWLIAQRLKKALEADGATVRLTKSREKEYVPNRQRAVIANGFNADFAVRLHCDSASGSGFAVYYPDRQGTARDGKRGPQETVIALSTRAARPFHDAMARSLKGVHPDRGLFTDLATAVGGKQGALTGSIYSEVPVALVEMCVLTNPRDEAFLAGEKGQAAMTEALRAAVAAALAVLAKPR